MTPNNAFQFRKLARAAALAADRACLLALACESSVNGHERQANGMRILAARAAGGQRNSEALFPAKRRFSRSERNSEALFLDFAG